MPLGHAGIGNRRASQFLLNAWPGATQIEER